MRPVGIRQKHSAEKLETYLGTSRRQTGRYLVLRRADREYEPAETGSEDRLCAAESGQSDRNR